MKSLFSYKTIFVLVIICLKSTSYSQTTFYDLNTIQKIEIYFSQPTWDYQMDTAKYGFDSYTIADSIKINSILFNNVGVKYKGNSSYDSTYKKNPLHIELNHIQSQSYQGIKDIKLGNGYSDPSMIREVLSYSILKNYMHCPKANFAQVYINDNYIGVYSNIENIGKDFCSNHFYSSNNTFVKCNPTVIPGPTKKSNLKYISNDSLDYLNYYELKSTAGWNELIKLCDTITNFPASTSSNIDVDRVLWMLAFNNVLVNLDSYSGVFAQNYYLYKDDTKHFNPIIWDLNMSFGGFPYLGSGNTSMGSLTITNMQQLSPVIHSTDNFWPLIKNIMSNAMYKRMYIAHMKTIVNELFSNAAYQTIATQLQSLIDTAVQADSNSFFSYSQFQNGMTANATVGSYVVPGINNLMSARVNYLQATTEFSQTTPTISSVTPNNSTPTINSIVTITTLVTNANSVYLGYRHYDSEKFTRILMYDDGAHNDGNANDNIYGSSFTMSSSKAQYYIYAENSNAGIFSPERAEHEFYTLQSNILTPTVGQIRINEFLAINQSDQQNEYFQYQDWIELYNPTSSPLDLFGLYLTDDYNNKTKFAFPPNTIIQPASYLMLWADEDPSTTSYLHCNFKLSGSGEQLMISNSIGTVIDSITFGAQTADVSTGRCPNGNGPFINFNIPSFMFSNCVTGINEKSTIENITVYPNPATTYVTLELNTTEKNNTLQLYNSLGQIILQKHTIAKKENIDVSNLPSGIYFIKINTNLIKNIIISR